MRFKDQTFLMLLFLCMKIKLRILRIELYITFITIPLQYATLAYASIGALIFAAVSTSSCNSLAIKVKIMRILNGCEV